ncbi:DUF3267 domain-containing protein [Marinilactibacillus psychrotolerans]|nr:DUF3267 domain-containing protein [Marinilactibacillus psychrotolerans]
MTLIKEYNLIENKKAIFWLNMASIPLFIFFLILFIMYTYIFLENKDYSFSLNNGSFIGFILFFLLYFLLIVFHELIHGLFFKVFKKDRKVKFGFKNGFAYATSPHSFYSKGKFIWICLTPFTFITLILLSAVSLGFIPVNLFVNMASLHAAACVGDFYWVFLLSRHPGNILVEDTEQGMTVYLNN